MDPAALAALLLFTVEPTDRALAGWAPYERQIQVTASEQWITDYLRPEYMR